VEIVLHTTNKPSALSNHYRRALSESIELYIVSAYLTEWDADMELKAACRRFRLLVGKDFGITRKEACKKVLKWLPAHRKADFMVADQIAGFHPKAVFWKTASGESFMLVGSSNLTRAAFERNVEANVLSAISEEEFLAARKWIDWIAERSVPVSEDWLDQYVEASRQPAASPGKPKPLEPDSPVVLFNLPKPPGAARLLRNRRVQLEAYSRVRPRLMKFFRSCATGSTSSSAFFDGLPSIWSWDLGNRLQGNGWERRGKNANFTELAASFVSVLDARKHERDDVVRLQLDLLCASRNPARKAFLSEMLCLRFPHEYPVLNNPVNRYLSHIRFSPPRGASEGARYIDLAKKLRVALRANPAYPAKNLAELDALIWTSAG